MFFKNGLAVVITFLMAISAVADLDPNEIAGFEVLVAGKCDSGFQCAFGHSFLRIVRKNGSPNTDPVLAFTTNDIQPKSLADKIGFAAKGLFGLPLNSDFTSIGSVTYQYMNIEKREFRRVPLQMTEKNKEALIKNINLISSAGRSKDKKGYDILFNNCAGKIVELLNNSGLPRELFGIAIPNNLPDYLFRTYNAHYPVIDIPYKSSYTIKDINEKFTALPDSYYKFCEENECAEQVIQAFNKYFPNGKIEYPTYQKPDPEYELHTLRTRSEPTHWNGNKPTVERHYQLLDEAQRKIAPSAGIVQ